MALDAGIKKYLRDRFKAGVRFDEPMAGHTSLGIGGPADAYVMPDSEAELVSILGRLHADGIPFFVLGAGTNLLVRDHGIRGVVISLTEGLTGISRPPGAMNRVDAMAGARLAALCRYALAHSLAGMNFALGIPGTVGGGIVMNAGTALGSMAGVVKRLRMVFEDGEVVTIDKSHIDWRYRGCVIDRPGKEKPERGIILSAGFLLDPADSGELKKEAEAVIKRRKTAQPIGATSAGCFFKNPPSGASAGSLIDQAGLKGFRSGNVGVSEKHANFILNLGGATAEDVIRLMETIQASVYRKFNLKLEPEVEIVGE